MHTVNLQSIYMRNKNIMDYFLINTFLNFFIKLYFYIIMHQFNHEATFLFNQQDNYNHLKIPLLRKEKDQKQQVVSIIKLYL